jgi:hypothetical protein
MSASAPVGFAAWKHKLLGTYLCVQNKKWYDTDNNEMNKALKALINALDHAIDHNLFITQITGMIIPTK